MCLNCTRILEHSEINSTLGKYSRKYGIQCIKKLHRKVGMAEA